MFSLSELDTIPQPIVHVFVVSFIGIVAWLIKNSIIRRYDQWKQRLIEEWEFRIREIYSPLYYWSGALVSQSADSSARDMCVRRIQEALSKGAYVIPSMQYYVLVRQVEKVFHPNLNGPNEQDFLETRQYLYSQIELLNYYLFKGAALEDADSDYVLKYKYLLRWVVRGIMHLLVWLGIVIFIILVAAALRLTGWVWGSVMLLSVAILFVAVELRTKEKIRDAIKKRTKYL